MHLATVLAAAGEPTFIALDNIRGLGVTIGGLLVILLGIIFVWRSRKTGAVKDNSSGSLAAFIGIAFIIGGSAMFAVAQGALDFLIPQG